MTQLVSTPSRQSALAFGDEIAIKEFERAIDWRANYGNHPALSKD
ncbi:hypothetical protein [Rhizobium sp. AC44/96]|jgi:hypothetical protein|nr:hypothetical protein [Rhizobium sp. AC44/96]